MKTVFFTGKGGVGKSTLSAAAAWQIAQKGYRVLAVSFDPAHKLGDIFETKLTHRKKRFKDGLYLQEVDLEKAASEYVKASMNLMKEVYGYLQSFNMDSYFSILKYSPGIDEYAALTALEKILAKEGTNFDYIIFDTPPTGLTLHIFALPGVTLAWLDRLIKLRKEILAKRFTIHNIQGKYAPEGVLLSYKETDDNVIKKLYELRARYSRVQEFLQGKDNQVVLVFNPDVLSLKESQRLLFGLEDLKLPFSIGFNNKVTGMSAETVKNIENELRKKFPPLKIQRILYSDNNLTAGYKLEEDIISPLLKGV